MPTIFIKAFFNPSTNYEKKSVVLSIIFIFLKLRCCFFTFQQIGSTFIRTPHLEISIFKFVFNLVMKKAGRGLQYSYQEPSEWERAWKASWENHQVREPEPLRLAAKHCPSYASALHTWRCACNSDSGLSVSSLPSYLLKIQSPGNEYLTDWV